MPVLCRFKCESVLCFPSSRTVRLTATDKADFSKYTPSGTFEFSVTNENVFPVFEPGKVYDIAITEALVEQQK